MRIWLEKSRCICFRFLEVDHILKSIDPLGDIDFASLSYLVEC